MADELQNEDVQDQQGEDIEDGFDFEAEWEKARQEVEALMGGAGGATGTGDESADDDDDDDDDEVRSELAATQKRLAAMESETSETKRFLRAREEARQVDRLAAAFVKQGDEYEQEFHSLLDMDHGLDAFERSRKQVVEVAARARKRAEQVAEKARRETMAELAAQGVRPLITPRLAHDEDAGAEAARQKYDETGDEGYLREYLDRAADGFMGHRSEYR